MTTICNYTVAYGVSEHSNIRESMMDEVPQLSRQPNVVNGEAATNGREAQQDETHLIVLHANGDAFYHAPAPVRDNVEPVGEDPARQPLLLQDAPSAQAAAEIPSLPPQPSNTNVTTESPLSSSISRPELSSSAAVHAHESATSEPVSSLFQVPTRDMSTVQGVVACAAAAATPVQLASGLGDDKDDDPLRLVPTCDPGPKP